MRAVLVKPPTFPFSRHGSPPDVSPSGRAKLGAHVTPLSGLWRMGRCALLLSAPPGRVQRRTP